MMSSWRSRVIDVRFVVGHGLWILGAAVLLSAFSYYDWAAGERGRSLWEVLRHARGWRISRAAGVLLGASGFLILTSTPGWARALWLTVWIAGFLDFWRSRATS
jgi:hypothetical protein